MPHFGHDDTKWHHQGGMKWHRHQNLIQTIHRRWMGACRGHEMASSYGSLTPAVQPSPARLIAQALTAISPMVDIRINGSGLRKTTLVLLPTSLPGQHRILFLRWCLAARISCAKTRQRLKGYPRPLVGASGCSIDVLLQRHPSTNDDKSGRYLRA